MFKPSLKSLFLATLSLSILFTISQSGCSNKNTGGGGDPINPQANPSPTANNGVSCPSGAFRILNSQNQDTTTNKLNSLYPQYVGHYNGYVTVTGSLNEGGAVFSARNYQGSTLKFYKNNVDSTQSLDVKSPVRSLKIATLGGQLNLLVGTWSNFQQIPLNPSNGAPSGPAVVFEALGGVNSITTLGDDIYVALLNGDVAKIPSSTISSQGGCSTIAYSASTNIEAALNRPMKVFRVEAASNQIYMLSRNYGLFVGNINDIMQFFKDFNFSNPNFLKWKTELAKLNPANGEVTVLPSQLANRKLTLMQDLTGDGKSVFAPFWAFVDRDVNGLNTCTAASSCIFKDWLAFFLNSTSGINAYQGTSMLASLQATPLGSFPDELGCPAADLLVSCIRIPNLGLFFKNVIGASDNKVVMRGLFGFAEIENTNEIGPSSSLRVKNIFSPPPGGVNLGLPYRASGIPSGLESAGFFLGFFTGSTCSGNSLCGYERSQLSAGPTLTVASTLDNFPFEKWNQIVVGASHTHAYIYNAGVDKFVRVNLSDISDTTDYTMHVGASFAGIRSAFPAIKEMEGSPDRILAFFEDMGGDYVLSAYNHNAAADTTTATFPIPAAEDPAPFSPILMDENIAVMPVSYNPAPGDYRHKLKYFKITAWPAVTVPPIEVPIATFEGKDAIIALRNFEKNGNEYKLSMLAVDPSVPSPLDSPYIKILTFTYDGTTLSGISEKSFAAPDLRGFDATGGSIYVVKKNGDIVQYDETGTVQKTYTNAMSLAAGQIVGFSSLNARSGKLVASAIVSGSPGNAGGFKTVITDPATNGLVTVIALNPYFLAHVSKSKTFFGSRLLGTNGIEAFDLSRAVTAPNIVTGNSSGTPAADPAPAAPLNPAGAVGAPDLAAKNVSGGGCMLQTTSLFNLFGLISILGLLPLLMVRMKRK